jgi:hypothetical protein
MTCRFVPGVGPDAQSPLIVQAVPRQITEAAGI